MIVDWDKVAYQGLPVALKRQFEYCSNSGIYSSDRMKNVLGDKLEEWGYGPMQTCGIGIFRQDLLRSVWDNSYWVHPERGPLDNVAMPVGNIMSDFFRHLYDRDQSKKSSYSKPDRNRNFRCFETVNGISVSPLELVTEMYDAAVDARHQVDDWPVHRRYDNLESRPEISPGHVPVRDADPENRAVVDNSLFTEGSILECDCEFDDLSNIRIMAAHNDLSALNSIDLSDYDVEPLGVYEGTYFNYVKRWVHERYPLEQIRLAEEHYKRSRSVSLEWSSQNLRDSRRIDHPIRS